MKCNKLTSCPNYLRRGEIACSKCKNATKVQQPAPACSRGPENDEESEDDEETDGSIEYEDEYGNTGEKLFRVTLKRIEYSYATVEIAADDEDDAYDRANELDCIDYDYDDCDYENDCIEEISGD